MDGRTEFADALYCWPLEIAVGDFVVDCARGGEGWGRGGNMIQHATGVPAQKAE